MLLKHKNHFNIGMSAPLKVLIEDLFEVSKANSNNIVLNKMELDVVNLIKQVSIEQIGRAHV